MHSEDKLLYNFFDNLDGQLTIPIYQRGPAWKDENYNRLWDDLMDSIEDGHWLDRTICKKFDKDVLAGELCEIHIIDGQQRFTAMIVLYTAICAYCKNNKIEDIAWKTLIYDSILINHKGTGEKKYRLKLRGEYNEVLKQLIDNLPIRGGVKASKHWNSKNNSNEVLRMYNSFYGKLNNENIYDIWNSVRKVQIVDVQCEDKDNPQRVFDCINSTGVPLRLFEQIKNGTLMEYEEKEQIRLYYKYWEPLISYFKHKVGKFDEFFVMILRYLKQGKVTGSKNMGYIYFKRYMEENNLSSEDFLIMVLNIFNYYKIFNGDESSGDAEIDAAFENLVIFNASATIFPVLLSLYTYYDRDISYKPDLLNCLKLLETQLMRGVICGRRAYNVLKRFDLSVIDNRNLLQSLIKGFKMLDTSFISDADFKRGLNRNREWYNGSMKRVTNGFLKRIEMSYHEKGEVSFKRYSIEHIMPQTLNETWKIQLGTEYNDIHDNYVNAIGNLTLTAYNTEMSNKTFEEKLNMKDGFKDDRLHLNKSVAKYNHWNEDTIKERTNLIIEKSLEIWKYPPIHGDVF